MADEPVDFPQAVTARQRRGRFRLVWLVPIVALLVGGWLALRTIAERGPTVTITFLSAEGLEAGKTRIRHKDVDVGVVRRIELSPDRARVVVEADLTRQARDFLVEDTRFWVVRPRIGSGGITGLGTIISGAHIGVDVGKSSEPRQAFEGLERPPILTNDAAGRTFDLRAEDLASIDYGTPVYFRRLQVGEVVAYELDKDGRGVTIRVFVRSPFDQFVTLGSRFWEASGVDVELDASGLRVNSESLAALVTGGIAFGAPAEAPAGAVAPPGSSFRLFRHRAEAMLRQDPRVETYLLRFRESVRGLQVGAPVDFRGIVVGAVEAIGPDVDVAAAQPTVAVTVRLYPDRFTHAPGGSPAGPQIPEGQRRREFDRLVASGLRAQLRTGNLLTGQIFVALDLIPEAARARMNWSADPPELPTAPGAMQDLQATVASIATKLDRIPYDEIARSLRDLQASLASIAAKLDRIPYDQIAGELRTALADASRLMRRFDGEVAGEIRTTLAEARRTFASAEQLLAADAPMQQDLRNALREVARAAQSLRTLADTLEREPEALLRGRKEEAR